MSLPVILESAATSALFPLSISVPVPSTSAASTTTMSSSRKVFCDLDGVLVDFEHGIKGLFPASRSKTFLPQLADLEKSTMWAHVNEADAFFKDLPWTVEGKDLWTSIQHLRPDILTGVPNQPASARHEKYQWVQRELGPFLLSSSSASASASTSATGIVVEHVDKACPYTHGHRPLNQQKRKKLSQRQRQQQQDKTKVCQVITCWSSNKHYESGPGHVLIDDRESLRKGWERKGGIFIHHRPGNLQGTLDQLEVHGLLLHQVKNA